MAFDIVLDEDVAIRLREPVDAFHEMEPAHDGGLVDVVGDELRLDVCVVESSTGITSLVRLRDLGGDGEHQEARRGRLLRECRDVLPNLLEDELRAVFGVGAEDVKAAEGFRELVAEEGVQFGEAEGPRRRGWRSGEGFHIPYWDVRPRFCGKACRFF